MNKRQKLVQQAFLDSEEVVISRLKKVYDKSFDDITKKTKELQDQINTLDALANMTDDANEKARLLSMQQSKIYQKQYQDALKKQIGSILDNMQVEEFKTVSEYLQQCYEDGFIGTMFDLQGQGIPLCFPLDQEAMVRAVQTDSKISQGLYTRLGEDVTLLKRKITAQVSRSISTGMSYAQTAQQLAAYTNIGFNNAVRIARTEGHRIQVQSAMDACYKAKDSGADIVKQWDASLDKRTRESHQQVDGEIRELDKPFSNGLKFPGDPDGGAAEVVNCRCALLQRAKWALDADELETLKERAAYFGLDKADNFKEYKKTYLKVAEESAKMEAKKFVPAKSIKEAEAFARDVIGIPNVSFKGVDIRVANSMNESLSDAMNYCPDLRKRMQFYGSAQERNKQLKKELEEYFTKQFEPRYGAGSPLASKYGKRYASRFVGKVSSNTYATAYSGEIKGIGITDELRNICQKWSGISVNANIAKDYDAMLAQLKHDVSIGWHPVGCESIKSIFDHEFGHQLDYAFNLSNDKTIKDMYFGKTKLERSLAVSQYGSTNIKEFIAEAYCEYVNNPKARETATQIGNIIESKVNGK